jgi:AraC-like DNA-binding protein
VFSDLGLGASLLDGQTWYPIHTAQGTLSFEFSHGAETPRWAYNERCLAQARRAGKPLRGEYAGFSDLFAAIGGRSGAWSLVVGPFAVARPTSGDILSRWHALTGRPAHASEPEFLHYVQTTLATPTLEGSRLEVLERIVACLAELCGGHGATGQLADSVLELSEKLADVRFAERMWDAAHAMVDVPTAGGWLGLAKARDLALMGVGRLPQHAVVGLLLGRDRKAEPVDDLIRRDAFQRAAVELVRKRGGVLCGRLGDHGISLLVDDAAAGARLRAKLTDIGQRTATVARRFGFELYVGVSAADGPPPLPARYQSALGAAEEALSRGNPLILAEGGRAPERRALGEVRRQIAEAVAQAPSLLLPRFDRYLETLVLHCGHRLEPVRAHLEACFDQVTDALRATGTFGEKILADLEGTLYQSATDASTIREIGDAYRAVISEIEVALRHPPKARQDRSLRRAAAFVRDHLAERLDVARVARIAGFAPRYFSKLFRETEGVPFHRYVARARLEHAKRMLATTTLSVERIGRLAGFPTRSHFHRAFKQIERMAPLEYRRRAR